MRRGVIEELERFARRVRVLPLAAPLFLLVGFAIARIASPSAALPGYEPLPGVQHTPRFRLRALDRWLGKLEEEGFRTSRFVTVYRKDVEPLERVLRRRGVSAEAARRMAWPLAEQSRKRGIDPATVLAVVWVESRAHPGATSSVGARGLMQVMPMHVGQWRSCGHDLYDVDDNLCNGVSILAWYLRRFPGDERQALLGYNGCVRGTVTPDCRRYPDRVLAVRGQIRRELAAVRRVGAAAAAP